MENRERSDKEILEVPTRTEILDYILAFNQKPSEPTLAANQYTVKRLMDESGFGKSWCKERLREMFKAGLCEREQISLRTGIVVVYTFKEVPKFSS